MEERERIITQDERVRWAEREANLHSGRLAGSCMCHMCVLLEETHDLRAQLAAMTARAEAAIPKWICEFCYTRVYLDRLPDSWEFMWQSAVCPDCHKRVLADGGYSVVKGGAYAFEVPDPRPWESRDAS